MGHLLLLGVGIVWLVALGWAIQRRRQERMVESTTHDLALDLLAGGGIFLATLAFFWRTVSGDVYQPADGGDLVSFLFPTYRFAADTLTQGGLAQATLPLWNPYLYGGAPFISDIQAGFLYLPNLILFLLQPDFPYVALQWLVLCHLAWAGLGMYVLLRTLTWPTITGYAPVARPAALFGALAFMFSDPLLTHLGNLNLVAVLSWLPWLLAAYHQGLATRRWGWLGLAGLIFALANYAGHAQSSLYLAMALGIYTLGWALTQMPSLPGRAWLALLARLATTVLLAILLSAPILLPAAELTAYTARSSFTYQETTAFSLAPTQLLGILTPGFFGRGPALHWSLWDRVETPYMGVVTLLLALGALAMAAPDQRRRLWPWLGLALFGLLTALGVYTILHGWLTLLVPTFGQMRAPARALVLWSTGMAVVAAMGVDLLLRQGEMALASTAGRQWRTLLQRGSLVLLAIVLPLGYLSLLLTQENETAFLRASVALLALTLAAGSWLATWAIVSGQAAGWWSRHTAAALLIGLLYFDLAAAGAYTDISAADPTIGFRHPEIVEFLRADPDVFRIDSRTDIQDLWQPDTAALYGLEDVGGIANPLTLRYWQAQWEATGGRQSRLYDMLNAKYVIVRDGTPLPEGKFELALDAPGDLALYRNLEVLPRVWVVYEAQLATDVENALAQIQAPDFDPTTTMTLLNDERMGANPFGPLEDSSTPGQATISQRSANRMVVDVAATAPGFLLLSEVWYPGWQATVNGQTVPVVHANGALRAVGIPAGASTVTLWFAPASWRWGVGLAALGMAGFFLLYWLDPQRA